MARCTPKQWAEIRGLYEGGISAREIGKRYKVTHAAILKRAKQQGWAANPATTEEKIRVQTIHKVTNIATAADTEKLAEIIDEEAERRASVLRKHREEWLLVDDLVSAAVAARKPGYKTLPDGTVEEVKPSFEPFKQAKIIAETLEIKQRGERRAWGMDGDGKPQRVEVTGKDGKPLMPNVTPILAFGNAPTLTLEMLIQALLAEDASAAPGELPLPPGTPRLPPPAASAPGE